MEVSQPVKDASITALADALDSDTVFYTPPVVNTPAQVERDIGPTGTDLSGWTLVLYNGAGRMT
jgi:hypothetical protein